MTLATSHSDEGPRRLTALRRMMAAYQSNGTRLGWLQLEWADAGSQRDLGRMKMPLGSLLTQAERAVPAQESRPVPRSPAVAGR